ncbi:cupin domain-containing protein [Nonomuraea sp. NPDC050404]|uniref:cupin domain-containing protein n=1 Tax=Nonomuraea sp. NPDC050404 TaxID=3155783 RepID=UPI00340AE40C
MRKLDGFSAALDREHGIQIGRWSQYDGLPGLPFGAMWCVIPPASASAEDRHPEVELAVVMSGSADLTVAGRRDTGGPGTAFLFEPEEPHVIVNPSTDEPLMVLSIYWMPEEAA